MTTQHTPGPWKATTDFNPLEDTESKPRTDLQTVAYESSPNTWWAIAEHCSPGDARLIAAAPDLLAAARAILDTATPLPEVASVRALARAAIAKVTGQGEKQP